MKEHLKENRWSKVKHDNNHSKGVINANFKIATCAQCILCHQCFHVHVTSFDLIGKRNDHVRASRTAEVNHTEIYNLYS